MENLAPAMVEALMHRRAEEALKASESKLRYLADQLLTAQENERKRLASELHDELGHALLALKLHLSAVERKMLPEQEDLKKELRSQLDYINEVIQEVRRLYHDLSPGDVEDLGLTKALRALINDFAGSCPPDRVAGGPGRPGGRVFPAGADHHLPPHSRSLDEYRKTR